MNQNIKKLLVNLSNNASWLFFLPAGLRSILILKIVKALSYLPGGFLLVSIFDPNIIRKKISYRFNENLASIKCYGGRFLVDVNEHLGFRFFMNNGFDPLILKVAEKLKLTSDSILLDIGANIGSTSIPFGLKFGGEIIAIEASKKNAFLLVRNASLNKVKIRPNIMCAVDGVMAKEKKWLKFYINNGNSAANSMFKSWNPSRNESDFEFVPTGTVDDILSEDDLKRIAIIKIDVEGAEAMVLKGFEKKSMINAPILFEYRVDVMKRDLNDDGQEIVDLLSKNHVLYGLEERTDNFSLCPFERTKPYANAIAIPKVQHEYFVSSFNKK